MVLAGSLEVVAAVVPVVVACAQATNEPPDRLMAKTQIDRLEWSVFIVCNLLVNTNLAVNVAAYKIKTRTSPKGLSNTKW